jgi:glycosyltransferase involved in cell wall biosynthesis
MPSIASKNPYYVNSYDESDERSATLMRRIAKFIDVALVGDHELYEYVSPFFKKTIVGSRRADTKELAPHYPSKNNGTPIIVHAPSQHAFKGTDCIMQTIDLLKRNYEFEFVLVQDCSNKEALKIYEQADIVIDQVRCGAYGTYAAECMALGKPVVCYIRPDLQNTYPSGLPIISANPDNLEKQLRMLLESPELRHNIGIQSREYAERVHDSRVVAGQLKSLYASL